MDDGDRVSDELHERLWTVTENLWVRRQTSRAISEVPSGESVLSEVVLTDEDIADADGASLPVVRAWLDAEADERIAVERDGETRLVRALLGD